jgi:hypothetical protein
MIFDNQDALILHKFNRDELSAAVARQQMCRKLRMIFDKVFVIFARES